MNHVHKLIRFSNGEIILGEVVEASLRHDSYQVRMRNVFKMHQVSSPDSYMMTTLSKFLHFIKDEYININKEHITLVSDVHDDVIEFMENYEEEDVDEEIEEKLAIAGIAANSLGIVH
jgi:hypothetical protein